MLIGWLVGWLDGWLVSFLVDWLIGWLVGWLVPLLVDKKEISLCCLFSSNEVSHLKLRPQTPLAKGN